MQQKTKAFLMQFIKEKKLWN